MGMDISQGVLDNLDTRNFVGAIGRQFEDSSTTARLNR